MSVDRAYPPGEPGTALRDGRLSWISLRLPAQFEPEIEAEFIHDYNLGLAPFRRTWGVIGGGVWIVQVLWDYYVAAGDPVYAAAAPTIAALRIGAFAIMVFLFWNFLLKKNADVASRRFERALVGEHAMVTAAICLLTVVAPVPYDRIYFLVGIMIVIVTTALTGLRARDALRLAGFQALVSLLAILWCQYGKDAVGIDRATEFFATTFSLLIASLLAFTSAIGVLFETLARRTFIAQRDLQRVNQALAQSNQALAQSNDEAQKRMQAVIELKERLRQDAEQGNREKSQFIASAVHDLRQPVQAMMNVLQPISHAIKQGKLELASELVDLSRRAVDTMQEQLAAILDISRLESGAVRAEPRAVDIGAELRSVHAQMAESARKQNVRLDMAIPPDAPAYVMTDAHFFRRILGNLIGNAVKYRDEHRAERPWVRVGLRETATGTAIEVTDNGIGIDQALIDQGEIFKPFYQANNQLAQGDKGVGLGLTIVKALVDLLPGHRLTATSRVGEGSCFSLTLPTAVPVDRQASVVAAGGEGGERLVGMYVILVEDDELVRVSTGHLLHSLGVICDSHASYEEFERALDRLAGQPDLVLSDYRLPNGKTAADVLRAATAKFGDVGFVVFSGEATDLSRVAELHGAAVLRKPLSPGMLIQALLAAARPDLAPDSYVRNGDGHT